jgi:hypothetical protein
MDQTPNKDTHKYYNQGWNDFVDQKQWPGTFNSTIDYRDGWHDARDYFNKYKQLPEKI